MPMRSQAQWRYLFANNMPFAERWAKATPGGKVARYRRLPRKKKSYTVADLERAVLKDFAPAAIDAIARAIPELPRYKGEQIAPGITRIHGNLCNVHGRYGRCPGAAAKPVKPLKPRKGRKPAKTPEQRQAERDAAHQQHDTERRAERDRILTEAGIDKNTQGALIDARDGNTLTPANGAKLAGMGLAEQAQDGSYRLTGSGREVVSAATRGDAGRVRDTLSAAGDAARTHQTRDQERAQRAADKLRKQQEAAAKPKKNGGGGGKKKPVKDTSAQDAARRSRERAQIVRDQERQTRLAHQDARQARLDRERRQRQERQDAQRTPQTPQVTTPELADAARQLQNGDTLSRADENNLVRNGLARRDRRSSELILTVQGQRATRQKAAPSSSSSFAVFKNARGRWRWTAISSTAYEDRDGEIVSTKALADDVAHADACGVYGPLRWWHVPGLDLGDCDFNALSGRVLIESGTFRSEAIAQKVARAAADLEVSLGFVHPPSEPDAHGVFHSIRRFERSLTPRGKASNLFTSFRVKELPMLDTVKKEALVKLGFDDAEIAALETRAAQTQKAADDQGVKFKAEEPQPPAEVTIGGVVYTLKAADPVAEKAPPPPMDAEDMADGGADEAAEGEPPIDDTATEGGLTLSPDDLGAIGELVNGALQTALAQIMGGLDLEKKVAGHVQSLMQPYQAQKDSEAAEAKQRAEQLDTRVKTIEAQQADLLGLRPAVDPLAAAFKASESQETTLAPDDPLLQTIKEQMGGDDDYFDHLRKNLFPGAAAAVPGQ